MPKYPHGALLFGPSSVAIHDDGNVLRYVVSVYSFLHFSGWDTYFFGGTKMGFLFQ
jgi:hypothetical protein